MAENGETKDKGRRRVDISMSWSVCPMAHSSIICSEWVLYSDSCSSECSFTEPFDGYMQTSLICCDAPVKGKEHPKLPTIGDSFIAVIAK